MGSDSLRLNEVNARLDVIERELLSLLMMVRQVRLDLGLDTDHQTVIE